MAAFYRIGPDGRGVPENPLASGFAVDSTGSHAPAPQSSPGVGRPLVIRQLRAAPTPLRIEISLPGQSGKDGFDRRFEAFRCERHGFFYTAEGRCVAPAGKRSTGMVHGRGGD
jgi:hypothetical protein